jgi:hypothetical protein
MVKGVSVIEIRSNSISVNSPLVGIGMENYSSIMPPLI